MIICVRNIVGTLLISIGILCFNAIASEKLISEDNQKTIIHSCAVENDKLVSWLNSDTYSIDRSGWSASLKNALNEEKLAKVKVFLSNYGNYSGNEPSESLSDKNHYSTRIHYQKGEMLLYTSCDNQGTMLGFRITPVKEKGARMGLNNVEEKEIQLISHHNNMPLHATLLQPRTEVYAISVLIPGSGPMDRNESQGNSTPFMDLANGLAEAGIASIRFDKRTFSYPGSLAGKDYTPEDEIILDAVTAAQSITAEKKLSHLPLFLIGHSQGGIFIPRITNILENRVAGIILLATPSNSDIAVRAIRQLESLTHNFPEHSEQYNYQLNMIDEQLKNWKKHKAKHVDSPPYPFNLPASYLAYLETIEPTEEIRHLSLPTLILQGGKDYKVLEKEDYLHWQEKLKPIGALAHFKLYPQLDHNFIDEQNHLPRPKISLLVISDIEKWIYDIANHNKII